jgi:hypothetical protein
LDRLLEILERQRCNATKTRSLSSGAGCFGKIARSGNRLRHIAPGVNGMSGGSSLRAHRHRTGGDAVEANRRLSYITGAVASESTHRFRPAA